MAVFLVRHAVAVGRSEWAGPDADRPLTKRGERQAAGLVELLDGHDVRHVRSSRAVRCIDTVAPLAATLGLDVERAGELFEGTGARPTIDLAVELAAGGGDAVLCSHGDVIPDVLRRLARDGLDLGPDPACSKGSTWRLDWDGHRFAAATYLPPTESDGQR